MSQYEIKPFPGVSLTYLIKNTSAQFSFPTVYRVRRGMLGLGPRTFFFLLPFEYAFIHQGQLIWSVQHVRLA